MTQTRSFSRMRLSTILLVAVLLPSFSSPAQAQPFLALTVGANAPFAHSALAEEVFFSPLWPVGFSLGARVDLPLTQWLVFDPTVAYRIYPFGGVDQEDLVQVDSRRFLSSSGELTQQLFIGLGLRLEDPAGSNSLVPFLDLRGGLEIERAGKITLQWQDLSEGSVSPSVWPAEYRHQWTFLAGIGLRARLSSRFSVEPSVLWHGSQTDRNYALASVDLVYVVPL